MTSNSNSGRTGGGRFFSSLQGPRDGGNSDCRGRDPGPRPVRSYLQNQGHETCSAANIEEASALLEAGREIDPLFTDIGLQGDVQAGLTLAQRATERRPQLKVLYTTGLDVTDSMKAMFVENAALLPKLYTVDQLQTTLTVNFGIKPLAAKL